MTAVGKKGVLIAVAIVVILAAVGGVTTVVLVRYERTERLDAKDEEVKRGIVVIQNALTDYAVNGGDTFPSRIDARIRQSMVSELHIPAWPTNPFDGQPMQEGTDPGDFQYLQTQSGDAFTLTAFGHDAKPLITVGPR
jgi:hypothetical protein